MKQDKFLVLGAVLNKVDFMNYELVKKVWTDDDFDLMGWHDSHIYGIAFAMPYQIAFDIDYIFQWVSPTKDDKYYKFWISPCTLIFENVHDLNLDIEISEPFEFEVSDIKREVQGRPINAEYIKRNLE